MQTKFASIEDDASVLVTTECVAALRTLISYAKAADGQWGGEGSSLERVQAGDRLQMIERRRETLSAILDELRYALEARARTGPSK